jgi:hypothetical protein
MNLYPSSLARAAAGAVLALAGAAASAADFDLAGQIGFHKDVVQIDFVLNGAGTNVSIWTDSWRSGLNFDPLAALWVRSGSDWSLLQEVDDDDTVAAGQGFYDTGFALPTLAAGQYRVTLAAAPNTAAGTLLSQGFAFDGQAPIALASWNQPSYDPNANDQKGGAWALHLRNVDSATVAAGVSPIPEPETWALLVTGLALVAGARRGRARRG